MAHVAPAAPAKQHPGERLADYFDNFFKTVVAISTFGSSLTFTKIVQTPVVPWVDYGFSKISIQYFLSNAFLFFVLDLAITSFAASALTLYRPQAIDWFGTNDSRERRIVMWYATIVSAVLFGLLIAAFIFVALVVTAYAGPAGWLAIAATSLFGALGFGIIIWQGPMFSSAIGQEGTDTLTTDMRIYGYGDEKSNKFTTLKKRMTRDDSGYASDKRQEDGYASGKADSVYVNDREENEFDSEKRTGANGQYEDERLSWRPATHKPITPGDHYYEERRTSRARRMSNPAPKYYEYDNERV